MPLRALHLLGDRVDVAKAALKRLLVKNRCRPGGVIKLVDHFAGLLDRPGRGEAGRRGRVETDLAALADRVPDLLERGQEEGAGRSQPRARLRDLRLDDLVVAQGSLSAAWRLVRGQRDKAVVKSARDAEGEPGEPGCIQ